MLYNIEIKNVQNRLYTSCFQIVKHHCKQKQGSINSNLYAK